jgi:hypothetical protein
MADRVAVNGLPAVGFVVERFDHTNEFRVPGLTVIPVAEPVIDPSVAVRVTPDAASNSVMVAEPTPLVNATELPEEHDPMTG